MLPTLSRAAALLSSALLLAACSSVKLVTLDPGHFHASLVQKSMYSGVDPVVHVYAPGGATQDDLDQHLKRIAGFNQRAADPTAWREIVYTGPDFFERMLAEKSGNVVVIAGNNQRKTEYILKSIQAGFDVLADKPMVVNPSEFGMLKQAFDEAEKRHVLLYDIMTERYEIWSTLQRELMHMPEVFGTLVPGTAADPAISMESVHYFSKVVAGAPLKRPAWFFDVRQEGEGLPDVGTHLVDLVQWEAFPDQILHESDVRMLAARRYPTPLTRDQLSAVIGGKPSDDFPEFLKQDVANGYLQVYANGECTYQLKGIVARVSTKWDYQAAQGGDTHYALVRGTRARLVIRQGAEQDYKPMLYVESAESGFETRLNAGIAALALRYPGIGVRKERDTVWSITVPAAYDVGHEAHFAQVMNNFLAYRQKGSMPAWEVPNMLTKYATLMQAYEMSHR